MSTAVVVINWNGFSDTVECVQSMLDQTISDYRVFLVDNGSDGDDAARLADQYAGEPRVELVRFDNNEGFARGVNRAIRDCVDLDQFQWVALLNNDAVVERDWLEQLQAAAHRHNCDLIASRMTNYYQRDLLDNAGHEFLNTGEILPRGAGQPAENFQQDSDVLGACGGGCLISTRLIRQIGLFDPFFETGYEDAEFGLRAFLAGYRIVYAADAVTHHKISQSINKIRDRAYAVRLQVNINYTYLKLTPWPVLLTNAPFVLLKTFAVPAAALLFLRWTLLSVQLSALWKTLEQLPFILKQRRLSQGFRRRPSLQVIKSQRLFLQVYLDYLRRYLLGGEKTVFER
ncbi:MAG: glycosyltransferase family 2 protein [Xanthomonadales bacterium]|nr:glycosyltransferase family 2 protein [Xanthomonadales bacterium]